MRMKNSIFTLLCRPYQTKAQKAEGPELRPFRTTTCFNKAFTLIELLVVVLIIGLLAAIALPQYEKAVEKAKAAQAWAIMKHIQQAQQAYFMANGKYAATFSEMGVDLPFTGQTMAHDGSSFPDRLSNQDWTFETNRNVPYYAIYATRLTGKYKGGGFAISFQRKNQDIRLNEIVCTEALSGKIHFGTNPVLAAGDYCKKIFNGTYIDNGATTVRSYYLP